MSGSLLCFVPSVKAIDCLQSWMLVLELELSCLSCQLRTECDPLVLMQLHKLEIALRSELLAWCIALVGSECLALDDTGNMVPPVIDVLVHEYGYIVIPNIIEELHCNN